jgi:RNA polymerase sigma-B factor
LIPSIRAASELLTQQLSRNPTPTEIANQIGTELANVTLAIEAASGYNTAPLTIEQERHTADTSEFEAVEARATLPTLLDMLSEIERKVVELRFFDRLSQEDIADRLGVSQMQVSRLLRRSLDRLRTQVEQA